MILRKEKIIFNRAEIVFFVYLRRNIKLNALSTLRLIMKKMALLSALCCFISLESTNMYRKTFQENSSMLTWQDEEWPNESFSEYLTRCYGYQQDMQEFKKRKSTAQMFDTVAPESFANAVLYDVVTGRDINLLSGSKIGDPYVAQLVDRTDTIFGKMALFALLNNPIDDINRLRERQTLIKMLIEHEDLYEQLKSVFALLAKSENMMLSFWMQDGFLQASKRFYFQIPFFKAADAYMNSSSMALELKSLWGHQTRFLSTSISFFATFLLPLYLASSAAKKPLPEFLNQLVYRFQGEGGPILSVLSCSQNASLAAAGVAATTLYVGLNSKESYDWTVDCVKLEGFFAEKND